MENSFLKISKELIINLNERTLPEFINMIMYYEIAKLNLLHQGLHISLNTKSGDGGSDGEFINFTKQLPKDHPFLPNKNIIFQFKSENIVNESWLRKEISKNGELKPKLKELIEANYTYILISNKTDLPTNKIEEKEIKLKKIFQEIGYPDVNVKIIDCTVLMNWANTIPQICFKYNPHLKRFKTFNEYEKDIQYESENIKYVSDDKRNKLINTIQEKIKNTLSESKRSFIRVEGHSGIGKTRFIYESLNSNEFKNFVIYTDFYDELITDILTITREKPKNLKQPLILIIDECPYKEHTRLCKELRYDEDLIFISINQILSEQDYKCKDEKRILLEGLEENKTINIVRNTNSLIDEDSAKKIAYYSEGYPRFAFFLAKAIDIKEGMIDKNYNQQLERIVENNTKNTEERKLLRVLSIFRLFPHLEEQEKSKNIIFEHFNIDISSAFESIERLKRKGIVRNAGRFLYISPRPISIYLFSSFLETYPFDFIEQVFEKLKNESLLDSFFSRLGKLSFETAKHKELLFRLLSELTYKQLNTELGSSLFHSLCLKDRQYSIKILNKIFQDKNLKDIKKFDNGRRDIVWSLHKLISFDDTFNDSAKLLFKFALGENEHWGNNATGEFINVFQWILSGTETNITKRLKLLQNLYLEESSKKAKSILLDAFDNALPKHHYTGSHKNHSNQIEKIPDHYDPKTQEDIDDYFKELIKTIELFFTQSNQAQKEFMLNSLINSFRISMRYSQLNLWLFDFLKKETYNKTSLTAELLTNIKYTLEFDEKKLKKTIIEKLNDFLTSFVKSDVKDIKKIFFSTDEFRYISENAFNEHCQIVAKDILESLQVTSTLIQNDVSNLYLLGKEVAKIDTKLQLEKQVFSLIPNLKQKSDIRFITSYITSSSLGLPNNYQNLLEKIYSLLKDKTLMFFFLKHFDIKEQIIRDYYYKLLKDKTISSDELTQLTYGFYLRDLSIDEFVEFIDKVNTIINNKHSTFGLCFQYINHYKNESLIEKYFKYYLDHNILEYLDDRKDNFEFETTVEIFLSKRFQLEDKYIMIIWSAILDDIKNNKRIEIKDYSLLYKIIQEYKSSFWTLISSSLESIKPRSYERYSKFVDFMQGGSLSSKFELSIFSFIDSNSVIDWLKSSKYKDARYIIANSLNIDFYDNKLPNIVINLLKLYPNDKELYSAIKASHESWSGSYVSVANKKLENIESMLEKYKDISEVIDFLNYHKKNIEYRKKQEQKWDEERYYD